MKFSAVNPLLALFAAALLPAEAEDVTDLLPTEAPEDCVSISELACTTDGFEILCEAVITAGLDEALSEGTWTVFAPTNEAFEALDPDLLAGLLNNTEALTDVLTYHAVAGTVITSVDLVCTGLIEMANGRDSRTVCSGETTFQKGTNNPRDAMPAIISPDIGACNGVVHAIDQVMLPPF